MKTTAFALALAGLFTLPFTGCGPREAKPDVKIGLVAELTGKLPAVGRSCKNAAELVVAEINQAGGIKVGNETHGILLVIEDSTSQPEAAAAAAKRLIEEEKVVAFVGPNISVDAIPAAAVAEASQTLMISPWSTAPQTTLDASGTPKKWVSRTCFTDTFQGHILAKFAFDYMQTKKAATLFDASSQAPKAQAENFKSSFETYGGKVVAYETYGAGAKDLAAQLGKIKEAGPEVVFLPTYYPDVPDQLRQARAAGIKVPFLGSDNWSSPDLIKKAGKDIEGCYYSGHYYADLRNDTIFKFVAAYKKRFGGETPDDVAALTYDTFNLLAQAMAAAPKVDRAALRDSLAAITSYQGVTGKMIFTKGSGDPQKSAVMMQVKGGQTTFVTNIDPSP